MRARRQAGVTLMELLIAVTLLSMISVGLLFALRIGLTTYSKAQTHLMDNRRVVGAQRILQDEIAGMVPITTACGGGGGGVGGTAFFQGEPQTMRLVSTFSLQEAWRGLPQILEFTVISGDDGGVRLVVNEIPFYNPMQAGRLCADAKHFLPVAAGPKSFVLADKLAACRFTYLRQPDDPLEQPVWESAFTGRTWPVAVRVEMRGMEPDFARLQPITVTAPLKIHKLPEIPYDDM
jgi:general secretion pathway protein J